MGSTRDSGPAKTDLKGDAQSPVPRQRRAFTDEFKRDAVRLVTTGGYTFAAAAKSLGVGEQSLR